MTQEQLDSNNKEFEPQNWREKNVEVVSDEVKRHPEANTALFLGLISIPLSTGPIGLATSAFGIIAGIRTMKATKTNPDLYTPDSYKKGLAGLICSIVALAIFGITSILYVSLV